MTAQNHNSLVTDLSFSEAEQEKLIGKLWTLLKMQATQYNSIDSTSMPIEKAQDILESMLYTIGVVIENGATKDEILHGNLSLFIDRGQSILKKKQKSVKVEWKLMCQELPRIRNVYYLSTLKNLGVFFDHYEIYYEAHHIPCSIDYWPLCPVPERIKGISFIEEYVHHLQIENDFLNCFDRKDIIRLYKKYVPDYTESLFNLCEPVLTNAIGLGMLGQHVQQLNISPAHRNALYQKLLDRSVDEIQIMLEHAILFVCREIGLEEKAETDYLTHAAAGLSVRVYEALKHQDLSHIFLSCSVQG